MLQLRERMVLRIFLQIIDKLERVGAEKEDYIP